MSSTTVPPKLAGTLLRFRVMAFATGVMLITACSLWIAKAALGGGDHLEPLTGTIWMLHGFLYIVYVLAVLELGFKARWGLIRIVLVMLAGTIPTMSFVAEHYVTRQIRARGAEPAPSRTGSAASSAAQRPARLPAERLDEV